MAVRASMTQLINLLEDKVNDTGNAIWSTQNLQDFLDQAREHIFRELLTKDVDEKRYFSRFAMLEGDASTWDDDDTIIKMWNSNASGASSVTPDSFNLIDGTFTFTSDQNATYYLDAITYDLNEAAALCMLQLATDLTRATKWTRGGVSFTGTDFVNMAGVFRSQSGPTSLTLNRKYPFNPADPQRRTVPTRARR